MTPVFVDSNVLIDIVDPSSRWTEWSQARLVELGNAVRLVINSVVFAEISVDFAAIEDVHAFLDPSIEIEEIPLEAAFAAGRAFFAYRRRGGIRRSPLPDFFIGAHAAVRGFRLLTRDARRYQVYFPKLEIIAPESPPRLPDHP